MFLYTKAKFYLIFKGQACEIRILIKVETISRASRCSLCERQGGNEDVAGTYLLVLVKVVYVFLAVPGLRCSRAFSQVAVSRGSSLAVLGGFLTVTVSLVAPGGL